MELTHFAGPEDEAVLTEMRRLLSKVEEMKGQRAKLEKQFRDEIQKDDITTVLMAADSTKEVSEMLTASGSAENNGGACLDSFKCNLKMCLFPKQETCHVFCSMLLFSSISGLCLLPVLSCAYLVCFV